MADEAKACSNKRILVVDDIDSQRDATVGTFEALGYECVGCGSGEEALKLLAKPENGFSVCVLDQQLQSHGDVTGARLSGIETLRQMKARFPGVRVIVFTAYEDRGREAVRNGAFFYVQKPVSQFHLVTLVDALIKMRQLEDEVSMTHMERDRLQSIIDAMGVEVMVRDLDYNILLVNKKKKAVHGIGDEVIGRKCYEVFERNRTSPCPGCPADMAGQGSRIVLKEWDWGGKTLLINAGLIRDSRGSASAIAEVVVDITKRKNATKVVQKIQSISHSSVASVADQIVQAINEIGYSRVRLYLMDGEAAIGCACRGMGDGFDIRGIRLGKQDQDAARAFEEGKPFLLSEAQIKRDTLYQALDKDGAKTQIEVPLISAGEKIGLLCVDDKGAEEELTEEDLDIMTLFSASMAYALRNARRFEEAKKEIRWLSGIRDIDKELTIANNADVICQAVAKTLKDLLNADSAWVMIRRAETGPLIRVAVDGDLESICPNGHPGNIGVLGRCLKDNKTQVVRDAQEDKDFMAFYDSLEPGLWKDYLAKRGGLVVVPVRRGEKPVGACVVHFTRPLALTDSEKMFVEDIAGRVAIALAKIEEHRQIEAANIELAKLGDLALFTSGMAHAIKNPLSEAITAVQLAEGEPTTEYAKTKLAESRKSLKDVAGMIDRLVRWTKPTGRVSTPIPLDAIIEELHDMVAQKLVDGKIEFRLIKGRSVRQAFIPPDWIKMAALDLFANAVRAMPGGGRLTVEIRNVPKVQAVELAVSDTGFGMPPEKVQHLFDWEFQDGPPAGGMHLGLYLAKKVITATGGTIECRSVEKGGTTFTIRLPAEEGVRL